MPRTAIVGTLAVLLLPGGCTSFTFSPTPEPPASTTIAAVLCTFPDGVCPPNIAQNVIIDGVVTAVDTFDENGNGLGLGNIYIRDLGGAAPWSGLQLFNPTLSPIFNRPLPGDLVEIRGPYVEFLLVRGGVPLDPTMRTTPEIQRGSISKIGEGSVPAPAPAMDAAVLATDAGARPWVGSLITVTNVDATAAYDQYNDATTAVTGLALGRDLYEIPALAAGAHFSSVTGVLAYWFSYRLLPRQAADVVP